MLYILYESIIIKSLVETSRFVMLQLHLPSICLQTGCFRTKGEEKCLILTKRELKRD